MENIENHKYVVELEAHHPHDDPGTHYVGEVLEGLAGDEEESWVREGIPTQATIVVSVSHAKELGVGWAVTEPKPYPTTMQSWMMEKQMTKRILLFWSIVRSIVI